MVLKNKKNNLVNFNLQQSVSIILKVSSNDSYYFYAVIC